ncbi:MAG: MBL fold metallo-hydrolase [Alcaligenaceae bacterium]|nr:MBL fold metallo-hydrolase [Alcaligenaceae bacterium]
MLIPVLGRLLAPLLKLLCALLIKGNELFVALPWTFIRVVSPSLIFMVCYYLVFWFLSQDRPLGMRYPLLWCCGLVIAALALGIFAPVINNDLYVVFLDVGQGDCVYIRTPDEKHVLIDGGGKHSSGYSGTFDVGEDVVVPFLLKNGVWCLDLVVMSHAHDDHIEGLISVLDSIPVRAFMEYPPGEYSENYARLKELVAKNGIRNIYAYEGLSYRVGEDVWLDVMYPPKEPGKVQTYFSRGDNNRSLLLLLRCKGTSVLFTGDMEADVEKYLAPEWNYCVDVLKVAHHGSNTSSTDEWLEALNPQLAVIQVGKNNFGHPHPHVLQRLEERGVLVLRNDHHGAVTASYRNGRWCVRAMDSELLNIED